MKAPSYFTLLRVGHCSALALTVSFGWPAAAQDFCSPIRKLNDAATSQFSIARGGKTGGDGDYVEYELKREYMPLGVRAKSDCNVNVLMGGGKEDARVECLMKFPSFDHDKTRIEGHRVAEAIVQCLLTTDETLGNSVHRFSTSSAKWLAVVPRDDNHIAITVIPAR